MTLSDDSIDHSIQSLKLALQNLEAFAQQLETEPTLKKTIALAYNTILSSKSKEHSARVLNEILQSSDVVKSYFPLIQVLEEGTPEQKNFAQYAKNAIQRYNNAIEQTTEKHPSWKKKIARLFYQKSGVLIGNRLVKIELPQKAFVHIDFPRVSNNANTRKIATVSLSSVESIEATHKISTLRDSVIPTFQVPRQTLELYYMKIISLLEKNPLMSLREARALVLKAPTQLAIDKQTQRLTISQQLIPLPGQCIHVSATFQIDPRTLNYNIFHSDFLSVEATQTGFPHPLQHHGWALSTALVPRYLHRPHQLLYFPNFFNEQIKCAQELLPNGSLNQKARAFLNLKRQAFEEHKDEFLSYHHLLALSIVEAAENVPEKLIECTSTFFKRLADHTAPYDFLSQTYEEFIADWITSPFEEIDKFRFEGKLSTLEEAQRFLEQTMKAKEDAWLQKIQASTEIQNEPRVEALLYTLGMGRLLTSSIQQLILQQQSELMKYAPPELSLFTKKLQIAAYLQLWEFQHELALEPNETDMFRRLGRLLEDDITLFKAQDFTNLHWDAVAISHELEAYYKKRADEQSLAY